MVFVSRINFVGTRNCFVALPQEVCINAKGVRDSTLSYLLSVALAYKYIL